MAMLLLYWHQTGYLPLLAVSGVMLFPGRRRILLSLASVGVVFNILFNWLNGDIALRPDASWSAASWSWASWLELIAMLAVVMASLGLAVAVARRFEQLPGLLRRFPLLALHAAVWMVLIVATVSGINALMMASTPIWRVSYLLTQAQRGRTANTRFRDHLLYLVPLYGGSPTPMGKGLEYLSRHEANDAQSIARSQLAGLKLLILALVWGAVLNLMSGVVYAEQDVGLWREIFDWSLNLPTLKDWVGGTSMPSVAAMVASIYFELIRSVLNVAVTGHIIIGTLRIVGFNVFRNTYKPLLAESIVEFWNRYYFYFKELLVDFFFYPTYLRCTWAPPRLRMFLAVFAAAFAGNMYYHILAHPQTVLAVDAVAFWTQWGPRFVYCLLLALGIWVSMLRQQARRKEGARHSRVARIRAIAGVWTFFALIQIFNISAGQATISDRIARLLAVLLQ